MPVPKTRNEMRRADYEFLASRPCKGSTCGRRIEIWRTTNGSIIALDPVDGDDVEVTSHALSCPSREELKALAQKKNATSAPARRSPQATQQIQGGAGTRNAPGVPALGTKELERELASLRHRSGAIAAVLVYETAGISAWKQPRPALPQLDPEDVRNSMISAANFTRDAIRREREGKAGE